jgi:hypothetical protein
MKKIFVVLMCFIAGSAFASGVGERIKEIDEKYSAKVYPSRPEWLYDINQISAKLIAAKDEIQKDADRGVYFSFKKDNFDVVSYEYKVLLDIGKKQKYINDATYNDQIKKGQTIRDEVTKALAKYSGGLGLE